MILVTGATGLTGSFVVEELSRCGEVPWALTRADSVDRVHRKGLNVVIGDLRDSESLRRAASDASAIVHTACTYTDREIDVAAMRSLLEGWRRGAFVYLSSLDVYGLTDDAPITEEHTLSEGMNDYATGKVQCERLLAEAATASGLPWTALRAPYIWGPHPTARERLVNARLRAGQPIVLPGATAAEWSRYLDAWIDVRDLAKIVVDCLAGPGAGALNVLAGQFVWHDLYAELIALTGSASELVHRSLDAIGTDELPNKYVYARTWEFSTAKLQRLQRWAPGYTLHATLRDTVAASSVG